MSVPITKHYRVRIDSTGLVGAAPADGFIDHMNIQSYYTVTGVYPSTTTTAYAKSRAYLRYLKMISFLNEFNVTVFLYNIDNGGATPDTHGLYFEFTVVYERADHVYTYNELYGTAHPSGTMKILTLTDAIKRQVARVWIQDFESNFAWPRNPSKLDGAEWEDIKIHAAAPTSGTLSDRITAAESVITVTEIPNT